MKAAVLGSPITHSKSPLLHTAAYAALGLDWTYERYEVREGELAGFLRDHAGEFKGLSLTMPLKDEACRAAEMLDAAARTTGACNTLVFDGRISGYNTDVVGFIEALHHHGHSDVSSVCILGTGATARSAATALLQLGVQEINIVGRRREALHDFSVWFNGIGGIAIEHDWLAPTVETDLTVSTTTAGATDDRALPDVPGVLFDVIYAPWPTSYARRWLEAGGDVLGGIDLLVHQAAEQVLLMTGTDRSARGRIVEAMYVAARIRTPAS